MSFLDYFLSGSKLKSAKKLTEAARLEDGGKTDQLFQEAYKNFASISASHSSYPDALYNWGFALLHQAQAKSSPEEASKIFEEAITKFSACTTLSPDHLGAAMDGGVALLGLAKAKNVKLDDELYAKAKQSFIKAEKIQQGSASYNLACMSALINEGDACLKALENARDHGLIPSEEDIVNDDDLANVKQLPWFDEFIKSLDDDDDDDVKEKPVDTEQAEVEKPVE